jgi:hypothetical protein
MSLQARVHVQAIVGRAQEQEAGVTAWLICLFLL